MAYVHIYFRKHVATIETMSEASEQIKDYSCIVPLQLGMAICYQYESTYFPAPYADNHAAASFCGPKQSHTFNELVMYRVAHETKKKLRVYPLFRF